jgi:hypothetical protein
MNLNDCVAFTALAPLMWNQSFLLTSCLAGLEVTLTQRAAAAAAAANGMTLQFGVLPTPAEQI